MFIEVFSGQVFNYLIYFRSGKFGGQEVGFFLVYYVDFGRFGFGQFVVINYDVIKFLQVFKFFLGKRCFYSGFKVVVCVVVVVGLGSGVLGSGGQSSCI